MTTIPLKAQRQRRVAVQITRHKQATSWGLTQWTPEEVAAFADNEEPPSGHDDAIAALLKKMTHCYEGRLFAYPQLNSVDDAQAVTAIPAGNLTAFQYFCPNSLNIKRRRTENVAEYRSMVFEMDLERDRPEWASANAMLLNHSIGLGCTALTWSGNKSFHALFVMREAVTSAEWASLWHKAAASYGALGMTVDRQFKSPVQLSRFPGGVNAKTGKRQKLAYFNPCRPTTARLHDRLSGCTTTIAASLFGEVGSESVSKPLDSDWPNPQLAPVERERRREEKYTEVVQAALNNQGRDNSLHRYIGTLRNLFPYESALVFARDLWEEIRPFGASEDRWRDTAEGSRMINDIMRRQYNKPPILLHSSSTIDVLPDDRVFQPLEIVSVAERLRREATLPETVVAGLIRREEVCVLVAPPKAGKTMGAIQLAVSVATGGAWLDTFSATQGKVLYVDAELTSAMFSRRVAKIAKAMKADDVTHEIDSICMYGESGDVNTLVRSIKERGKYNFIVVDCLYRLTPPGTDENNNSAMAEVMMAFEKLAKQTGAAILVVHHMAKGSQASKDPIDTPAGAGSIGRAVATLIALTPEARESDVYQLSAITRSWRAPKSIRVRLDDCIWKPITGAYYSHAVKQEEEAKRLITNVWKDDQTQRLSLKEIQTLAYSAGFGQKPFDRVFNAIRAFGWVNEGSEKGQGRTKFFTLSKAYLERAD